MSDVVKKDNNKKYSFLFVFCAFVVLVVVVIMAFCCCVLFSPGHRGTIKISFLCVTGFCVTVFHVVDFFLGLLLKKIPNISIDLYRKKNKEKTTKKK